MRIRGRGIRKAADACSVSETGIWYRFQHDATKNSERQGAARALENKEEWKFVDFLRKSADHKRFLIRSELQDIVTMIVCEMPLLCRENLALYNDVSVKKYCKTFERKHSARLQFGASQNQEAHRFAAMNADVIIDRILKV